MKQHKIYDPKTKRYVEKTEQVGSLKKPDLCKGHRPHDFVLVLPPYTRLLPGAPFLNAEQIEAYYSFEEGRASANKHYDEFEQGLGVDAKSSWRGYEVTRYFVCANCGKKK